MKKAYTGRVENNQAFLRNKKAFNEEVARLNGKKIKLTIEELKDKRSLNQNALYWAWMTILGKDIGHTKEEMHLVFRKQFLSDKMPPLVKDEFMQYLKGENVDLNSTRKLNTKEMHEYMENVDNQAKELGIRLPVPDDKFYEEYSL